MTTGILKDIRAEEYGFCVGDATVAALIKAYLQEMSAEAALMLNIEGEKVEGVQQKYCADRESDFHGAAGEEAVARLQPLILAELEPGHLRDLHLGETKLFPAHPEYLPVVNNGGELTVAAPRELKRDIHVTVASHETSSFHNKPNLDINNIHPNWVDIKRKSRNRRRLFLHRFRLFSVQHSSDDAEVHVGRDDLRLVGAVL